MYREDLERLLNEGTHRLSSDEELRVMLFMVDMMAAEMKEKLELKWRQGYQGGLFPGNRPNVYQKLKEHIEREPLCEHQEIDAANLMMMLWAVRNYGMRGTIYDPVSQPQNQSGGQ